MATFPSITPSFSILKQEAPKQLLVSLGDGYEHRLTVGLQQNPKVYNLRFTNITDTEAETIQAFLNSRKKDNTSFNFTPPKEGFTKTGTFQKADVGGVPIVTVTITSKHGLAIGDTISCTFTGGNPANGDYTVVNDTSDEIFTLEAATGTGDVGSDTAISITKSGVGKYVCDGWSTDINYPTRNTITATFRQVFEP